MAFPLCIGLGVTGGVAWSVATDDLFVDGLLIGARCCRRYCMDGTDMGAAYRDRNRHRQARSNRLSITTTRIPHYPS